MRSAVHWLVSCLVFVAACGPSSGGRRVIFDLAPVGDGGAAGAPDLAAGGPRDLTTGNDPLDFSRPPGADLATPPPGAAVTGDPCAQAADCKPSMAPGGAKGVCTKSSPFGGANVAWPGGYCQAGCRPAKNDANGINVTDCSGDSPVCVGQVQGVCYAGCASVADCRGQYVCANITGTPTAACIPGAASECDPPADPAPQNKKCPQGQKCVDYSPDHSYGGCAVVCDPLQLKCAAPDGCIVDLKGLDGMGACIGVNANNVEGGACVFLNDCPAGMMCYGQKCRMYCRKGGAPGGLMNGLCPNGQICDNLKFQGVVISFMSDKTGICHP